MRKMLQKGICLLLSLVMVMGVIPVSAAEVSATGTSVVQVTTPDRAVRVGSKIFYAIGNDGGGDLICYNIKTKKQKTLVKNTKCKNLSAKGSYIYYCDDKYAGSDGANRYIYRIKTNGKGKKKLAKGAYPVLIGNYIYYIKMKLKDYGGGFKSDSYVGLYRMKLDGSGSEKVWSGGEAGILYGATSDGKLLFSGTITGNKKSSFLQLDPSTGETTTYTWSSSTTATTASQSYLSSKTSGKGAEIVYSFSGSNVYSQKTDTVAKTKVATYPKGTIKKLIDLDGYFFVVAQDSTNAYVYVSKSNGKSRKLLTKFMMAGGSWGS